jgi:hypothetical protein
LGKDIYLLFTNTETFVSRIIRNFTTLEYTHVSLSLNINSKKFFSFSRKYTYLILPGGFIIEGLDFGGLKRFENNSCRLCKLNISDEQFRILQKEINKMFINNNYRYNIIGLIFCYFNKPLEREKHKFCSEFVATMIEKMNVNKFDKHTSLCRPSDLMNLENLEIVFEGKIKELNKTITLKEI